MQTSHLKYNDVTSKVIGCAMKIHSYFGPGFPEIIYHRGTALELSKILKDVESEVEREIYYEKTLLGKRRLDLVAEKKVLVEFKAASIFDKSWEAQILNYMKIFQMEVGLILNFGRASLEIKRFVL